MLEESVYNRGPWRRVSVTTVLWSVVVLGSNRNVKQRGCGGYGIGEINLREVREVLYFGAKFVGLGMLSGLEKLIIILIICA